MLTLMAHFSRFFPVSLLPVWAGAVASFGRVGGLLAAVILVVLGGRVVTMCRL